MLARLLSRAAASSRSSSNSLLPERNAVGGVQARWSSSAHTSSIVPHRTSLPRCALRLSPSVRVHSVLPQQLCGGRRHTSSSGRPPVDGNANEPSVDVTPVGTKPWQITAEAIAEAEAAEPLDDEIPDTKVDILAGDPTEWEYDASTEEVFEAGRQIHDDDTPPTPILDAYERSRDPLEMERLIRLSFDSLPPRAGPQRYNKKKRERHRFRIVRNIKYKEKAQRIAAHERKLQKRRDRKAREEALFATWRGTGASSVVDLNQ